MGSQKQTFCQYRQQNAAEHVQEKVLFDHTGGHCHQAGAQQESCARRPCGFGGRKRRQQGNRYVKRWKEIEWRIETIDYGNHFARDSRGSQHSRARTQAGRRYGKEHKAAQRHCYHGCVRQSCAPKQSRATNYKNRTQRNWIQQNISPNEGRDK